MDRASAVSQAARAAVATPVRAAVVNVSVVTSLTGTLTGPAAAAAGRGDLLAHGASPGPAGACGAAPGSYPGHWRISPKLRVGRTRCRS